MPIFAGDGSKKPKKASGPRDRWRDLPGNFLDNVEEAAGGILPGLEHLGKSFYNDTDFLLNDILPGRKSDELMVPDVIRGIAGDFKTRYAPLFTGDLVGFKKQITTRPLDFLLDGATIATGGAAAVGKAGQGVALSAKTVQTGSAADRLARLAGYIERNPVSVADAAKVYGANSKEMSGAAYVPRVRTVGQGLVDAGEISSPLLKPVKRSPLLRGRDAQVDKLLDNPAMYRVPGIGVKARIARSERNASNLRTEAQRQRILPDVQRRVLRLSKPEQVALVLMHQDVDPTEYANLLRSNLGKYGPDQDATIEAAYRVVTNDGVVKAASKPTPRLQAALRATKRLSDEDMAGMMIRFGLATDRSLLKRRALPDDIMDGATVVSLKRRGSEDKETPTRTPDEAVERPLTREEALEVAPERVREIPEPDDAPSLEDVEAMLAAWSRRLRMGRGGVSRAALRRWLEAFYNQQRYGTEKPSRLDTAKQAAALRRAKARQRRGTKQARGVSDLQRAIDKYGVWSREAIRVVEDGGGYSATLWKILRDARRADKSAESRELRQIDDALVRDGIHPLDGSRNHPDAQDVAANLIRERIDEATDGLPLTQVADGVGNENVAIDAETAQAWISEARQLDPDLPRNPTNEEVANAIAMRLAPDERADGYTSRKEWVEDTIDTLLRYVDNPANVALNNTLRPIRQGDPTPEARLLERFGVETDNPREAEAIIRDTLRRMGVDDEYTSRYRDLQLARERLANEGPEAFRGERFVPDPDQDDFGVIEEIIPGLPLSKGERKRLRESLVRKGKIRPMQGEQIVGKFDTTRPMKQRELADADGTLLEVLNASRTTDELVERAGDASYFPHVVKGTVRGPGSTQAVSAARREPGAPKNATTRSLGSNFAVGAWDMNPQRLIEAASNLIRYGHALDLYNAAMMRGVPFDESVYRHGGQQKWVVLDPADQKNLNQRLRYMDAASRTAEDVLSNDEFAEWVRNLGRVKKELEVESVSPESIMVPRDYYNALMGDLKRSSEWYQMLVEKPLQVFRALTLFTAPAYYVNNAVGVHLMLALKEKGPAFIPAYAKFLAENGHRDAARALVGRAVRDEDASRLMWRHVIDEHAPHLRGAFAEAPDTGGVMRWRYADNRLKRGVARMIRTPDGLARFGAIITDDLPRQFRFARLMQPHIEAARRKGVEGSDPEIGMRILREDKVLAERVTRQVLDDLIDYRTMSPFERRAVRAVIPFYGWLRGITEWTLRLGYDNPADLWALVQIGEIGVRENEEWAAGVPGYLAGAIRIGEESDGQQRVLTTTGLNPFQTLADVSRFARSSFSGDATTGLATTSTSGQLNPVLRSVAQAWLNDGKDFTTDLPMGAPWLAKNETSRDAQIPGGAAGASIAGFFAGLRPFSLANDLFVTAPSNQKLYGEDYTPGSIYQGGRYDKLASFLGVPMRTVNVQNAQARRLKDDKRLAGEVVF